MYFSIPTKTLSYQLHSKKYFAQMIAEEWLSMLLHPKKYDTQYTELNVDRILKTLDTLYKRILERFPGSGLGQVCGELVGVGADVKLLVEKLGRPIWLVRIGVVIGIVFLIGITGVTVFYSAKLSPELNGVPDLIQTLESITNELIFLAIALFFLGSLEVRLKRHVSLRALHRLRSIAHVVDMHQLTKDPAHLLSQQTSKLLKEERVMTSFELTRYLDYCSELLSIVSKLAALQVQYLNDPVILNAVNDLENLTGDLSNKIWQKIMILDITGMVDRPGEAT